MADYITPVEEQKETQEEEFQEQQAQPEANQLTPDDIANMTDEQIEQLQIDFSDTSNQANSETPVEPAQEAKPTNEVEPTEEVVAEESTPNYEEFYNKLTTQFKADGQLIQIKRPEDMIQLMQMGVNYRRKLAKIQPHLGVLKSLEQRGLLDKTKVNQMIELMEGKPEAIAQLLKDKEIDTFNLEHSEKPYIPNNYIPSDASLQIEEKVAELRETPIGIEVLNEVDTWDEQSLNEIGQNPKILDALVLHKQTGLYQATMAEMAKAEILGQLDSVSRVQAYDTIATRLLNSNPQYQQGYTQPTQPVVVGNNIQKPQPTKANPEKKSASIPTGRSVQKINPTDIIQDITQLSDEEIERLTLSDLARKYNFKN